VRVGVDATSWVNRRGYGRFARNALSRLVVLDPSTSYVFYIDAASAPEAHLPEGAEERRVTLRDRPDRAASSDSNRSARDLLRLVRAARADALDAFLFPTVYTYYPVVGVPTVVGVHDVIVSELPHLTMPSRRALFLWKLKERVALRRATRLFTVSEASRLALSQRLRVPPDTIAIVPEAPDPSFRPREDDETAETLRRHGLVAGDFLVYAAGISPHKSLETLLEALAILQGDDRHPQLVLAGDVEHDSFLSAATEIRERIAALGLETQVRLPGFVPDEDLARLYSTCAAAVVPSLAEGFGLPAVEAAACGAPAILSDLPAHRETLSGAALFFPPKDVAALAARLREALREDLRPTLGARGRAAVAGLSWDLAAERLRALLADVSMRAA
jgi:glycosyltransferase involved in cell wall biosynthesis